MLRQAMSQSLPPEPSFAMSPRQESEQSSPPEPMSPRDQSLSSTPTPPVFARLAAEINLIIFGLFCDHCQDTTCEYQPRDLYIPRNDRDLNQIALSASTLGLNPPPGWGPSGTSSPLHDGNIELDVETFTFLARLTVHFCGNARAIDIGDLSIDTDPFPFYNIFRTGVLDKKRHPFNVERLSFIGSYLSHSWPTIFYMRELAQLSENMPKLRTLHFRFAVVSDWNPDLGSMGYGAPSEALQALPYDPDLGLITRLELVLCVLYKDAASMLLSSCVNLTNFTYISHGRGSRAAAPSTVANELHRHCPALHKTVRRLTLEHFLEEPEDYQGVYSSMRNLLALEEVYLGANGLFAMPHGLEDEEQNVTWPPPKPLAHILPPNIISLDIFEVLDWKKRVGDAIIELLEEIQNGKARFSKLREIRVWSGEIWVWLPTFRERMGAWKWDPEIVELARTLDIEFCIEPKPAPLVIRRLRQCQGSPFI